MKTQEEYVYDHPNQPPRPLHLHADSKRGSGVDIDRDAAVVCPDCGTPMHQTRRGATCATLLSHVKWLGPDDCRISLPIHLPEKQVCGYLMKSSVECFYTRSRSGREEYRFSATYKLFAGDKMITHQPSINITSVSDIERAARRWIERYEPDRARLLDRERIEAIEGKGFDVEESDWCGVCECSYSSGWCGCW